MIELTHKRAVELTLELWEYLAETGIEDKVEAMMRLQANEIETYGMPQNECWLCELYYSGSIRCNPDCLLYDSSLGYGCGPFSLYDRWSTALGKKDQQYHAKQLYNYLKEVENRD